MIVLAFAFVAGLLTILAPCTLPVVPLVLGGTAGGGRGRIGAIFVGFGASFLAVNVLFTAVPASHCGANHRQRLRADLALCPRRLSLDYPRVGPILASWR